jgi:hypothetical protein
MLNRHPIGSQDSGPDRADSDVGFEDFTDRRAPPGIDLGILVEQHNDVYAALLSQELTQPCIRAPREPGVRGLADDCKGAPPCAGPALEA